MKKASEKEKLKYPHLYKEDVPFYLWLQDFDRKFPDAAPKDDSDLEAMEKYGKLMGEWLEKAK